jgi:hypothetical protein
VLEKGCDLSMLKIELEKGKEEEENENEEKEDKKVEEKEVLKGIHWTKVDVQNDLEEMNPGIHGHR